MLAVIYRRCIEYLCLHGLSRDVATFNIILNSSFTSILLLVIFQCTKLIQFLWIQDLPASSGIMQVSTKPAS
jgi:hypothetical protein